MNVLVHKHVVVVLFSLVSKINNVIRETIEYKNDTIGVSSCRSDDDEDVHVRTFVLQTLPSTHVELLSKIALNNTSENETKENEECVAFPNIDGNHEVFNIWNERHAPNH